MTADTQLALGRAPLEAGTFWDSHWLGGVGKGQESPGDRPGRVFPTLAAQLIQPRQVQAPQPFLLHHTEVTVLLGLLAAESMGPEDAEHEKGSRNRGRLG